MNLPLSNENNNGNGFRTLNIVGHIIDMCEEIGFIFKREIIWHKTNGVRANFGTYPYPGGILINNMHEQILEFDKPNGNGSKYEHLSKEIKEASKLTKIFWLSLKNSDVWLMKPYKSGSRETSGAVSFGIAVASHKSIFLYFRNYIRSFWWYGHDGQGSYTRKKKLYYL